MIEWLWHRADLILNIIGTLLVAFSFGINLEEAHQTRQSWITKKEVKVYLASLLYPRLFYLGCGLLVLGFVIALVER